MILLHSHGWTACHTRNVSQGDTIVAAPSLSAVQRAIQLAARLLQQGDSAAAERLLVPLVAGAAQGGADALHLMGLIRFHQRRFEEAVAFLHRALVADPHQPQFLLHMGKALARLGRLDGAIAAFRDALALSGGFADAYHELGNALYDTGRLQEAESAYRKLLDLVPDHVPAMLSLGLVLIDAGRASEAETQLRQGLSKPSEPRLKGALHNSLALALRWQSNNDESLQNYEMAQALDPALPCLDMHLAEILQDLKRYDEAITAYRQALAREPLNPAVHLAYNDLLYRLGGMDDYLKSFDRAPRTRDLQLGKAYFLMHEKRGEDAYGVYRDILVRDPNDKHAAASIANALVLMKRYDEAVAAFDEELARTKDDAALFGSAAAASIQNDDPQKALALCEQGLALAPDNQTCLANMSTALRMMDDERDEVLNGYDTFIQVFDLEPPEGFSDMEEFNEELRDHLDRVHPNTREYINQSLRGGTQTPANLFGTGHVLVDRLQTRLDEAVRRYIEGLKKDDKHPFLRRHKKGFRYLGSWSSRLKDNGFHINHLHPGGWISSCYYVSVPGAISNEPAGQGWIKFGEPVFDIALKNPIRRTIQPAPGRLVLFPSYMWHGTVPFRSQAARTTIAFDIIPGG